ncbi:MAG: hypothetical protein Unbinned3818contig1000_34 [Prokaryotic dsDNA virus sp.]|nr:hypothetical protein [Phycisphaerae bacterium]QDP45963.1 MAG: hypothetical protein Unbinned3818contig1000_34 [Prokaryotic dsDNA virus sp.]|tara:strand:+ start:13408 stop:16146 length:2739 start_codon:yes stop_codon:yes gene_type:complete
MAIEDIKTSTASSGSSFTPSNWISEPQQSGDVIFLVLLNDSGGTPITVAGWNEIAGPAPNNSSRCSCFYLEHTGTDITAPTANGSSNDWIAAAFLCRGLDLTNIVNGSARFDINVDSYTYETPALTTTDDNCLVFRVYGLDNGGVVSPSYGYGVSKGAEVELINNLSLYVDYDTFATAGAVPRLAYNSGNATSGFDRDATIYTIAFSVDSEIEPSINSVPVMISDYSQSPTVYDISTIRPTIIGKTTAPFTSYSVFRADSYTTDLAWHGGYTEYSVSISTGLTVQMLAKDISSVDMSVFPYSITFGLTETSRFSADGPLFYFEDGAGNWAVWQPVSKSRMGNGRLKTLIGYMPDQVLVDFSGVIDWSDIVRTGHGIDKAETGTGSRLIRVSCECMVTPASAIGGTEEKPVTPRLIAESFSTGLGIYRANSSGIGQDLIAASVEIGNLVTPTYFVGRAISTEYPPNDTNTLIGYKIGDGVLSVTIKASSGCVYDFRSWTLGTTEVKDFSIDPSSSLDATYLTDGWNLKGATLDWKTGIACPTANFIECGILDIKGAEFIGGTVYGSISTTHSMTATDGAVIGYDFTKGDETYAIELSSVDGNYDLSQATFNGYTTELNISAATGTTTITLAVGQATPTYVTAGAMVLFVLPVVLATGSVSGIVTGSRLQIVNQTKAIKPINQIIFGTSYSIDYSDDTVYAVDDILEVRLTYQSGVTAKKEFSQLAVVTAGGWSVLAAQEDDDVYIALGVDGSTITKFTADYVNDEVDLTVATDFYGSEFYPWWVFNGTTASGIDEFFGGITAVNEANFRINNSIVSLYFDNTTSTNLKQLDNRRIYRDDGQYPVKSPTTGGGGIDIVWRNEILVASLGKVLDILEADEKIRPTKYQKLHKITKAALVDKDVIINGSDIDLVEP